MSIEVNEVIYCWKCNTPMDPVYIIIIPSSGERKVCGLCKQYFQNLNSTKPKTPNGWQRNNERRDRNRPMGGRK